MAYGRSYRRGNATGAPGASTSYQTPSTSSHSTSTKCTITWDSSCGAYVVSTPYEPNFIEFLKARIPGGHRAWDAVNKTWKVEEQWVGLLQTLATELWGASAVKIITRDEVEDALRVSQEQQRVAIMQALPPRERAIMEFIELLTLDALRAAYRKAAVELHPDRNENDGSKMASLNASWTKLENEFTKK